METKELVREVKKELEQELIDRAKSIIREQFVTMETHELLFKKSKKIYEKTINMSIEEIVKQNSHYKLG